MSAVSSIRKISEGYSNTRKEELRSTENNDEQTSRKISKIRATGELAFEWFCGVTLTDENCDIFHKAFVVYLV